MDPIKEAIEALGVEQIRAAGGIVHSDGNIFFTSLDQLQSAVRAALAAQQAGAQVPRDELLSLLQRARLYTNGVCVHAKRAPFAVFRSELDAAIAALEKQ